MTEYGLSAWAVIVLGVVLFGFWIYYLTEQNSGRQSTEQSTTTSWRDNHSRREGLIVLSQQTPDCYNRFSSLQNPVNREVHGYSFQQACSSDILPRSLQSYPRVSSTSGAPNSPGTSNSVSVIKKSVARVRPVVSERRHTSVSHGVSYSTVASSLPPVKAQKTVRPRPTQPLRDKLPIYNRHSAVRAHLTFVIEKHREDYLANNENLAPNEIDLRGLHREEALDVVGEFLRFVTKEGYSHAEIITGKGKNSPGGIAVLKPAVQEFLSGRYSFSEISGGGGFRVSL